MRTYLVVLLILAAALHSLSVGAGDRGEEAPISIQEKGGVCSVASRKTKCARLLQVMRDLAIAKDRLIVVSSDGVGEEVIARANKLAATIRAAGFSKVAAVGIQTVPTRIAP